MELCKYFNVLYYLNCILFSLSTTFGIMNKNDSVERAISQLKENLQLEQDESKSIPIEIIEKEIEQAVEEVKSDGGDEVISYNEPDDCNEELNE